MKSILVRVSAHEYSYSGFIQLSGEIPYHLGSLYVPVESACGLASVASRSQISFRLPLMPRLLPSPLSSGHCCHPQAKTYPAAIVSTFAWFSVASFPSLARRRPGLSPDASDLKKSHRRSCYS